MNTSAALGQTDYPPGWPFSSRPLRLFVLALVTLIAISLSSRLPAWSLLELRSFDYLSTVDDPPPPDGGPVIIAIDEPSLADINVQWPWPRSLHAELVKQLRAAGAKAIGLDIIMAEPSTPENDAAVTLAAGPDLVLAGDETLIRTPQADQLIRTTPMPQFTKAGARTGIASIELGGDMRMDLPRYLPGRLVSRQFPFPAMRSYSPSVRPAVIRPFLITRPSIRKISFPETSSGTAWSWSD
jgi:adenylate cyclase